VIPTTPYYGNYHIQASAQGYETSAGYDTGPVACNEELKIDFVLTPTAEEKEGKCTKIQSDICNCRITRCGLLLY
jgi:hypothetical protein